MNNQRVVNTIFRVILCLISFAGISSSAAGDVLKTNTVWSGEVSVTEDILVPQGVVLTIKAGTKIHISHSESTKTDPEYMSPLTEITVRGALRAEGTEALPISFTAKDEEMPETDLYDDSEGE